MLARLCLCRASWLLGWLPPRHWLASDNKRAKPARPNKTAANKLEATGAPRKPVHRRSRVLRPDETKQDAKRRDQRSTISDQTREPAARTIDGKPAPDLVRPARSYRPRWAPLKPGTTKTRPGTGRPGRATKRTAAAV